MKVYFFVEYLQLSVSDSTALEKTNSCSSNLMKVPQNHLSEISFQSLKI